MASIDGESPCTIEIESMEREQTVCSDQLSN
jgi:hypothetical protein